jgi:V-type H+-transporting ATPase subunit G
MASQTQGIQQLLAAEKRAAEKVSEARKRKLIFCNFSLIFLRFIEKLFWIFFIFPGKQKRLKQAKEEAQDEIEKYRQERERQFKEFEAKVSFLFLSVNHKNLLLSFE